MSPEKELELYREWSRYLADLFESVEQPAHEAPPVSEVDLSGYRARVGQDLRDFQEKLSKIMESENRGQ